MYQAPSNELFQSRELRQRLVQYMLNFSDLTYGSYWATKHHISLEKEERSHTKIHRSKLSRVAYCPDCIQKSIYELGFGYFKKAWWRSHWCRVHKKKLFFLTKQNKHLWEDILLVLRGEIPTATEQFSSLRYDTDHFKINASFGELYYEFNENFSYPYTIRRECFFNLSPCFQIIFLKWCFSNHQKILEQIVHHKGNQFFFSKFNAKPFIIDRYYLRYIEDYAYVLFNLLCREKPEVFIDFIANNAFYVEDENILKISNESCSKCPKSEWSGSCCLSREIFRKRLLEPVLIFCGTPSYRIGPEIFQIEDRSLELAKNSQIDTIHYIEVADNLCDFSDTMREPRDAEVAEYMGCKKVGMRLSDIDERYSLLGYHDPDLDSESSDPKRIDLPINFKNQITLIPAEHRPMLLAKIHNL